MRSTHSRQKIDVVIIRPFGGCSCTHGPWLSTIWDVLRKYEGYVRYHVKDTTSPEAKQFRITYRGIIVDRNRPIKSGSAQELDKVLQTLMTKHKDTCPDPLSTKTNQARSKAPLTK